MRIRVESTVRRTEEGAVFTLTLGRGAEAKALEVPLSALLAADETTEDKEQPVQLNARSNGLDGKWLFRDRILDVTGSHTVPAAEVPVRIKLAVLRLERGFERIQRQVEAFENAARMGASNREPIPDSVRLFVWQRDAGRCVGCGSQERLEFDHIIPLALGGSNTERNLQLLCEACNRSKGISI